MRYPVRYYESDGQWVAEIAGVNQGVGLMTYGDKVAIRSLAKDALNGYLILRYQKNMLADDPPRKLPRGKGWEWLEPSMSVASAYQLWRIRKDLGISQEEAARLVGVTTTAWQKWENPKLSNPTLKTWERIAQAIGADARFELIMHSEHR